MPHSRTDIAEDDNALRYLSGCRYKVLRALVNRADKRGIAYPGDRALAEATGYTRRSVQRSLVALEEALVIQYHRRDAWDDLTRRQLPNVMQINPDYISLDKEFVLEARELWDALIKRCGNDSVRLWSRTLTNTKQPIPEPIPVSSSSEPTPRTTKSALNGQGRGADYTNQLADGEDKKPKRKKQNPDREASQREARNNQRGEDAPKSSVPPRPQYVNPELVNSNLPDEYHERLASDLRKIGISAPLGRGFIVTYGYQRTKLAYDAVTTMGDKAREPGAVFRSILQVRLVDDFALAHEKLFQNRKQSGG